MTDNVDPIFEEVSEKLKNAGYKFTPQREVTMETLIENKNDLLTAEEIFVKVRDKNTSIGLATVYRTLDMLQELEIVKRIPFRDGMSRFDLVESKNDNQSYYLLCQNCGISTEVKETFLQNEIMRIENEHSFKVNSHQLTFRGLCKECLRRNEF